MKYKEINDRTRLSKNEQILCQILDSPRIKLSLTDSIFLNGKGTELDFADFIFALKR